MELITAVKGSAHITPKKDAFWHRGMLGRESCVFPYGGGFKTTIASDTEIVISSGIGSVQGRFFCILPDMSESVYVSRGNQGEKRIDLIAAEVTTDSSNGTQDIAWRVFQGTPVTSGNAHAPTINNGDLDAGDQVAYMPMYRVYIDGITITNVRPVFTTHTYPVELGGTGANNPEEARERLGIKEEFTKENIRKGLSYMPAGINNENNKVSLGYNEIDGLRVFADDVELKVPNSRQSKSTSIISAPRIISSIYAAEVVKDNTRLIEGIGTNRGMVVIHTQIKVTFKTSQLYPAGEPLEIGSVLDSTLRPPLRMPLTAINIGTTNRRYIADIATDGVINLRPNIDYTPTAGSSLNFFVTGVYVL